MKIPNKSEYETALKRAEQIFSARRNTPLGDELELLVNGIVEYEDAHFPLEMQAPWDPLTKFQCGEKQP